MMKKTTVVDGQSVVLVGHGAIPKDYPRELVTQLRRLEADRRMSGAAPSPLEIELETRLRRWPRTPQNDPYQAGLEALASSIRLLLPQVSLRVAYLEFCAPTLEEAVEKALLDGVRHIVVIPSMLTAGGVHSEVDIPAILEQLSQRHPTVELRYAWPFEQPLIAQMLVTHLEEFLTPIVS